MRNHLWFTRLQVVVYHSSKSDVKLFYQITANIGHSRLGFAGFMFYRHFLYNFTFGDSKKKFH